MRRIGAVALCLCLCVGLFPRKAEASFVAGSSALAIGTAATQTFFTSTGVALSVIEGGAAAGVAAVESAAASYVAATGAASSGSALLASIGSSVAVTGGTIIIAAAGVALLAGFAAWAASQYNDGTSEPVTVIDDLTLSLADGRSIVVTDGFPSGNNTVLYGAPGTVFSYPDNIVFPGGASAVWFYDPDNAYPYTLSLRRPDGSVYASQTATDDGQLYVIGHGTKFAFGYPKANGSWYAGDWRWFTNYVLPYQSPQTFNVEAISLNYSPAPEVGERQALSIGVPGLASDATVETMPQYIADAVGENALIANPPTVIADPSAVPDWDPLPDPLPDDPTTPEDPGTDAPFLPGDLPVPWDYVVRMIQNAAQFVSLAMVAFREALPTTLQDGIWASVVLAILFGMYRRFLG